MMKSTSLTLTKEMLEKIDADRGDIPRSRYVFRLLEFALSDPNNNRIKKKTIIPADNSLEARVRQVSIVKGVD